MSAPASPREARPEAVLATFGRNLRQARRARGMTVEQLAIAAGVAKMTVSRAERARRGQGVSLHTAVTLAAVLGASLDAMTGLSTPEAPR